MYSGSQVMSGYGTMLAAAVGPNSQAGKIMLMTRGQQIQVSSSSSSGSDSEGSEASTPGSPCAPPHFRAPDTSPSHLPLRRLPLHDLRHTGTARPHVPATFALRHVQADLAVYFNLGNLVQLQLARLKSAMPGQRAPPPRCTAILLPSTV